MARGVKTGGRNFGPDNPPKGRPKVPEDLRAAREMVKADFELACATLLKGSRSELDKILTSPTATVTQLVVANILEKTISGGDNGRFNFILDRMIGKVKDEVLNTHQGTVTYGIIQDFEGDGRTILKVEHEK